MLAATTFFPWISWIAVELGASDAAKLGLSSGPANNAIVSRLLGVLIASAILPLIAIRFFDRKWMLDRIVAQMCALLELCNSKSDSENDATASQLVDPLGHRREGLGRLALQLSDAARVLDARQVHGTAPHPISTLLRAISQNLSRFLRNQQSWSASIPADITEMFRHAVLAIAMPGDVVGFQALQTHLQAFDADGDPTVEVQEKPPGHMIIIMNRVAVAFKGFVAAVVGMATLAAIIIVCVLFAQHRISIIDFQHNLP